MHAKCYAQRSTDCLLSDPSHGPRSQAPQCHGAAAATAAISSTLTRSPSLTHGACEAGAEPLIAQAWTAPCGSPQTSEGCPWAAVPSKSDFQACSWVVWRGTIISGVERKMEEVRARRVAGRSLCLQGVCRGKQAIVIRQRC